jgi:hypothetical protein
VGRLRRINSQSPLAQMERNDLVQLGLRTVRAETTTAGRHTSKPLRRAMRRAVRTPCDAAARRAIQQAHRQPAEPGAIATNPEPFAPNPAQPTPAATCARFGQRQVALTAGAESGWDWPQRIGAAARVVTTAANVC